MRMFPRNDCHSRGTWKPLATHKGRSATITCPDCGTVGSLDGHGIHKDGRVWPPVMCPNGDCDFHDEIQLENWALN